MTKIDLPLHHLRDSYGNFRAVVSNSGKWISNGVYVIRTDCCTQRSLDRIERSSNKPGYRRMADSQMEKFLVDYNEYPAKEYRLNCMYIAQKFINLFNTTEFLTKDVDYPCKIQASDGTFIGMIMPLRKAEVDK